MVIEIFFIVYLSLQFYHQIFHTFTVLLFLQNSTFNTRFTIDIYKSVKQYLLHLTGLHNSKTESLTMLRELILNRDIQKKITQMTLRYSIYKETHIAPNFLTADTFFLSSSPPPYSFLVEIDKKDKITKEKNVHCIPPAMTVIDSHIPILPMWSIIMV